MNITTLKRRFIAADTPLYNMYMQLNQFLVELNKKKIPDSIVNQINKEVEELNNITDSDGLQKLVKQKQSILVRLLEKELKMVPINYYRNLWIALGMTAFGIPLGVAFGASLGNFALFALGVPVGLAIGLGVGMQLDKKALKEGRQLAVEMKY